ncbi:MAG: AI-2E family transporter, partial [Chloroflexota bacterium]|nr:AI-2E family transporter [Chloroflexota bacterium]
MNASIAQAPSAGQAPRENRPVINRWLQIFLTIIAGAVVAVITWTVIERFLHILILLLASFLVAYLLGPLVARIEKTGLPRIVGILLVYLVIIGLAGVGIALMVGPLTAQLQELTKTLPTLIEPPKSGAPTSQIDQFFQKNGINLNVAGLRSRVLEYVSGAGTSLIGGTLSVVAGLVSFVTDLFLVLAITFYLLLDGQGMRNRGLRLLPAAARERWFFIEATLNRVLGGYIRGQILVALTVGVAAGGGSAVLGVQYALVIGLLAFLFEFIPLLGPVLGMVPAVIISLFQPFPLVIWVIVYFIVLQQVESNVIVPRVSGHAVGLHPLAALLALLAG